MSRGVPLRVAVPSPASFILSQVAAGVTVCVIAIVLLFGVPSSASVAVIEYEYCASSLTAVTAVDPITGSSG